MVWPGCSLGARTTGGGRCSARPIISGDRSPPEKRPVMMWSESGRCSRSINLDKSASGNAWQAWGGGGAGALGEVMGISSVPRMPFSTIWSLLYRQCYSSDCFIGTYHFLPSNFHIYFCRKCRLLASLLTSRFHYYIRFGIIFCGLHCKLHQACRLLLDEMSTHIGIDSWLCNCPYNAGILLFKFLIWNYHKYLS